MAFTEMFITLMCSLLASSGLWTFLQRYHEKRDGKSQMLLGLGHDRIIDLGMHYIERGWITDDEYENLVDYLYKPYKQLGGNGTAKRIIEEVQKLEVRHISTVFVGRGMNEKS